MATAKSDILTLVDALPKGQVSGKDVRGDVKIARAVFEAATTDIDDNDVILMARVPMDAKIHSIKLFNDDLDTNGTPTLAANVGLYYGADGKLADGTAFSKGDVIDEDCYATAIATLQAANTTGVELAFEARDIALAGQEVFEDGGLGSNKPNINEADLAITISNVGATAAAGTIVMIVEYV